MSSTMSASAARCHLQLSVEIPPSPLHGQPSAASSTPSVNRRQGASSNASFRQVHVEIPPSPFHRRPSTSTATSRNLLKENIDTVSLKRKAEDPSGGMNKKARPDDDPPQVNCHQCNQKREPTNYVQCTFQSSKSGKRCRIQYCKGCLERRYQQDMEDIKRTARSENSAGHCRGEAYTFKCFRCQSTCNCWKCRKSKGLAPLGNVGRITEGQVKSKPMAPTNAGSIKTTVAKVQKPRTEQIQMKPLPKLRWASIPTSLDIKAAEDRVFIREFVMRFTPESGLSKVLLEELAFVSGSGRAKEDEMLADWVSESCVKALLIWLLDIILEDRENDANEKKTLKAALHQLRASSGNLAKMWAALSSLRATSSIPIADPLPCPEETVIRNTRSARDESPDNIVARPAQFVPIIEALINVVLSLSVVHKELDDGSVRHKGLVKEKQECVRKENERWEIFKNAGQAYQTKDYKVKNAEHKQHIEELDSALKVMLYDCSPRSGPIGVDHEGRKYWALSPGAVDRQYAKAILAYNSNGGKKPRRGRVSTSWKKGDGELLPDWSSIIAVWGRRPTDAEADDEAEVGGERWWMFSESAEVVKLAEWLAGIEERQGGVRKMKTLVEELKAYGSILKWKEGLEAASEN